MTVRFGGRTADEFLRGPDPLDEAGIRRHRRGRIQEKLRDSDVAGVVILDPVNLRYASGSRNMQVWTMHNICRYGFLAADGPLVLFDMPRAVHLIEGLETIDEFRPAVAFDYMMVGPRQQEMAQRWAAELADLVHSHGGGNRRLAVDRADLLTARALEAAGLEVIDGQSILQQARAIKSPEEVRAYKTSLKTCEDSVAIMRDALRPGHRESEALSFMLQASVARGGEYPETRLLTSGPRTNPWFQETSDRVIEAGDLLSFDTDLIGPMGFYNDFSRSWVVGEGRPGDAQRRLYDLARRQLEHNMALMRPGLSFREFGEKAYVLPDDVLPNRYANIGHGCGLDVEYPMFWYPEDSEDGAYDGVIEENMIVCLECYAGAVGGREGVKLEQPVWITADGPLLLCDYPLEDSYA